MDKPTLIRKGIMTVLTVLVIAYVIYVICRASFTQVKTMTAKETEVYDAIPTNSVLVKDEELIEYDGSGIISYAVADGEKISVKQPVAGVYDSVTSAGTVRELEKINSQIDSLTRLQTNADNLTRTPDEIDNDIIAGLIRTKTALNQGDLSTADLSAADILYCINERQLVTGKSSDYNDKINRLTQQSEQLKKEEKQSKKHLEIKAPVAGYFVGHTDGYENLLSTSQLDELLPGDLSEDKLQPVPISDQVIGKIVKGVSWYVACPVSAEEALKIKNAYSLKLDIPTVSSEKIKVDLYSINQKSKAEGAVVVLTGTFMNSEMAALRKGNFSIIIDTYNGLYVPKNAVHEMELTRTVTDENGKEVKETKTVSGVYVKLGNEVTFKQINILYSAEDYVISSADAGTPAFSDQFGVLQAYDEIIVEGANLYDGKIISRDT